jgi:tripartite-type tricarboxylate transporter receptor subunit TctC
MAKAAFAVTNLFLTAALAAIAPTAEAAPCLIVTLTGTMSGPPLFNGVAGAGTLVRYGDDSNDCGAVRLQFDAGRGTSLRLSQAGNSIGQLAAIFFTHMHSDHISGFADIMHSRWQFESGRPKIDVVCSSDAVATLGFTVRTQAYPARPVRIVTSGSGGVADIAARLMGQWLSERLGQPFVIENRTGAGSNIATEAVVRAPADGYTLLTVSTSSTINATLYDKLNFNFVRDITPIASFLRQPHVLLVNPSVPAMTVPEIIAYAKAHPGKINLASPGIGSGPHMAGELFKMMAGIDMVHVPYRGAAAALTDLLAGQVQMMFPAPAAAIEQIREGTLRPLAVGTAIRWEGLPDLPTIGDFLPGYEATTWFGVGAPRHTPAEIVDKLNREINAGLADPKMKGRLADLGGGIFTSSPSEFGKLIADETEKWGSVIRTANIRM